MLRSDTPIKSFKTPAVVKGAIVPDFSLEPYLGTKEVLLFFYPKDFTFVCPTELLALQERLPAFEERGVAVVGCSTDTAETHLAWLRTPVADGGIQGVTFPLIADVAKTIASYFGVLGGRWGVDEEGDLYFEGTPVAHRGVFLIDRQGIVRYQCVNDLGLGRSVEELIRVVDMWRHTQQHGVVCPANWKQGRPALTPSPEGIRQYMAGGHCPCPNSACRCDNPTACCCKTSSLPRP